MRASNFLTAYTGTLFNSVARIARYCPVEISESVCSAAMDCMEKCCLFFSSSQCRITAGNQEEIQCHGPSIVCRHQLAHDHNMGPPAEIPVVTRSSSCRQGSSLVVLLACIHIPSCEDTQYCLVLSSPLQRFVRKLCSLRRQLCRQFVLWSLISPFFRQLSGNCLLVPSRGVKEDLYKIYLFPSLCLVKGMY